MHYITLISTFNRFNLLIERSLRSVMNQQVSPCQIFIVNDGLAFTDKQLSLINKTLASIPSTIINTSGKSGAASAWNLGLKEIFKEDKDFYIAILDDDDTWDANHGELCLQTGINHQADIVISGLRLFDVLKNKIKERPVITKLDKRHFLTGNPGWQGSNTFVKKSAFKQVGGFTDGLQSCNDRDLAYRLLSLNNIKVAFTNQFTATWYFNYWGDCLTSINNPAKRAGLITFYTMYKSEMSDEERELFIERANKFFKVERAAFI